MKVLIKGQELVGTESVALTLDKIVMTREELFQLMAQGWCFTPGKYLEVNKDEHAESCGGD
jgi:hypothetical protein